MKALILVGVALAAGTFAVDPIGAALASRVVGGAVPTRLQDLVGYLALKQQGTPNPALLGPISPTDPTQANHLKELAALSLAGGLAVAALTYVLLRKVIR